MENFKIHTSFIRLLLYIFHSRYAGSTKIVLPLKVTFQLACKLYKKNLLSIKYIKLNFMIIFLCFIAIM